MLDPYALWSRCLMDDDVYAGDASAADSAPTASSLEDLHLRYSNRPSLEQGGMSNEEILYTPDFPDVSQEALARRMMALLVEKHVLTRETARGAEPIVREFLQDRTNLSSISEMLSLFSIMSKEKYRDRKDKKEKAPDFLRRVYEAGIGRRHSLSWKNQNA